jgi:ABC-type phosphate/phosphonate transport system ATPase subunit
LEGVSHVGDLSQDGKIVAQGSLISFESAAEWVVHILGTRSSGRSTALKRWDMVVFKGEAIEKLVNAHEAARVKQLQATKKKVRLCMIWCPVSTTT